MTDRDEIIHQLREADRETLAYLATLRPVDLERDSPIAGWKVSHLLFHLCEVDEKILAVIAPLVGAPGNDAAPPHAAGARTAPDTTDAVEHYRQSGRRVLDTIGRLPWDRIDDSIEIPGLGRMPVAVALWLRPFEQFNHTSDIARARGQSGTYLPDLLPAAFRFVRDAAPWLFSTRHARGIHLRIGYDFSEGGLGRWRLEARDGVICIDAWDNEPTDATVGVHPATFLLEVVLGKPSGPEAPLASRVRFTGDPTACERLRRCFPLLIEAGP